MYGPEGMFAVLATHSGPAFSGRPMFRYEAAFVARIQHLGRDSIQGPSSGSLDAAFVGPANDYAGQYSMNSASNA